MAAAPLLSTTCEFCYIRQVFVQQEVSDTWETDSEHEGSEGHQQEPGGKVMGTTKKAFLCIRTKKKLEKMSKKMEEVRKINMWDFLQDVSTSKKPPWEAEGKAEPMEITA